MDLAAKFINSKQPIYVVSRNFGEHYNDPYPDSILLPPSIAAARFPNKECYFVYETKPGSRTRDSFFHLLCRKHRLKHKAKVEKEQECWRLFIELLAATAGESGLQLHSEQLLLLYHTVQPN